MGDRASSTSAVMIHGLGSRGSDLALVAEALSPTDTLSPDLIGHGVRSSASPESIDDFAGDLLTSAPLPGRFVLAGLSFGAAVAMALWQRIPDKVAGVVLVDPPLDVRPLIAWAREEGGGLARLRMLYRCEDLDEAVEQMRTHPMLTGLSEEQIQVNARSLIAADNALMLRSLGFNPGWSDATRPEGSVCPLVVAFGARSIVCPQRAANELADRLGGQTRQLDSGHCPQLEDPAGLAVVVRSLIERSSS